MKILLSDYVYGGIIVAQKKKYAKKKRHSFKSPLHLNITVDPRSFTRMHTHRVQTTRTFCSESTNTHIYTPGSDDTNEHIRPSTACT